MMKKLISRTVASFCIAAVLAAGSVETFAANVETSAASVDLNSKNDFKITAAQDRDLFSNMKGLMPGDTVSNTVSLKNNSARAVTFYLKAYSEYELATGSNAIVRSDDTSENPATVKVADGKNFNANLLEFIQMTITMDGVELYKGSAYGEGDLVNGNYGISLGSIGARSAKDLVVTITLPGAEMDNKFADAFAATDWMFIVEGTDPPPNPSGGSGSDPTPGIVRITDGDVPLGDADVNVLIDDGLIPLGSLAKTGEMAMNLTQYGILLVVLLFGLVIVGRAKRREMNKK